MAAWHCCRCSRGSRRGKQGSPTRSVSLPSSFSPVHFHSSFYALSRASRTLEVLEHRALHVKPAIVLFGLHDGKPTRVAVRKSRCLAYAIGWEPAAGAGGGHEDRSSG